MFKMFGFFSDFSQFFVNHVGIGIYMKIIRQHIFLGNDKVTSNFITQPSLLLPVVDHNCCNNKAT